MPWGRFPCCWEGTPEQKCPASSQVPKILFRKSTCHQIRIKHLWKGIRCFLEKSIEMGSRDLASCVLARKPFSYLRLINSTVQSKRDCPLRPFCRGLPVKKAPVQLASPSGMASLPCPAPPLRLRPGPCSVKREGDPPGKPE